MSPLHNILGEDGEVLTIMSLLKPAETGEGTEKPLGEMTLQEAIERIYDIAGREGRAQLVLSLRRTLGEFTSEEDVTVAELSGELLLLAGQDGSARVVLRRLTVADEPGEEDPAEDQEDTTSGGFRDALHRFVAALRGLFNVAGEDGQQLTILSLLVKQPPGPGGPSGPSGGM